MTSSGGRASLGMTSYATWLLLTLLQRAAVCDVADGTSASPSGYSFPREWRGRYFQSGLGEIFIRDNVITTKGQLVDHNRDYFLLDNREQRCFSCLLLLRRHRNIIQYKESYCTSRASHHSRSILKTICSQIQVESPLYTLVREPAVPVKCPFQGAFRFTYNDLVSGFCDAGSTSSYAKPCAGHTRYQLKFNHCVQSAAFNRHNIELECLATWKDGSETYLYGKFTSPHLASKDEKFRCFKHHQLGSEVSLAMSVDATCQGLRSATDGPFLINFNQDTLNWPVPNCQFPNWLRGITWRNLNGQSRFSVSENGETFSYFKRRPSLLSMSSTRYHYTLTSDYQCLQSSKLSNSEDEYAVLSLTHHNCAVKRQCIKLQRLSNNAVKFYTGRWLKQGASNRCSADVFSRGTVLVAGNTSMDGCPKRGVHHTVVNNGCLHRVSVGCLRDNTSLVIDNSCASRHSGQTSYNCVTSWKEDDRKYVIVQRLDQERSSALQCFSFQQHDDVVLFSEDLACTVGSMETSKSLNTTPAVVYSLVRHDKCRPDAVPSRDVSDTQQRPSDVAAVAQFTDSFRHDVTLPMNHFVVEVSGTDDDTEYDDGRDYSGEDSNKVKGHYFHVTVSTTDKTLSDSRLPVRSRSHGDDVILEPNSCGIIRSPMLVETLSLAAAIFSFASSHHK